MSTSINTTNTTSASTPDLVPVYRYDVPVYRYDSEFRHFVQAQTEDPETGELNEVMLPRSETVLINPMDRYVDSFDDDEDEDFYIPASELDEHIAVERIYRCDDCGNYFTAGNGLYNADGERICPNCISGNYFQCDHCGDYHHIDDTVIIYDDRGRESEYVCQDCADNYYYQCDGCERYFYSSDINSDGYNHICNECYEDHDWCRCEDCNDLIRADDAYFDDGTGYAYCSSCWDNRESSSEHPLFNSYGHDSYNSGYVWDSDWKITKSSTNTTKRFFGIELEVDSNTADSDDKYNAIDKIAYSEVGESDYNIHNFTTFKHDGSLNDEGFEMAYLPMDMQMVRNFPWETVKNVCNEHGYVSHEAYRKCGHSCGLHVHVNKSSLVGFDFAEGESTEDIIAKMVFIIDKFWYQVQRFSRRKNFQWCQKPNSEYVPKPQDSKSTIEEKMSCISSNNHHTALNIRKYDSTVELRVCNGSLIKETIIASVQFMDMLCSLCCGNTLSELEDTTWDVFYDMARIRNYYEFMEYSKKRGLEPVSTSDEDATQCEA